MSADAVTALLTPAIRTRTREHVLAVCAVLALVGLAAVRVALTWSRVTPEYFPDEYIYAALGRSFSQLHWETVRGGPAHFPAVLQPLLTAAAWRAGSVETGYRIVQAIEGVFFTLVAIPVYVLGRKLSLSRSVAALAALVALLVPDNVYTGFMLADPIAYPLALAAALVGVTALARPTRRGQIAFLVLAALATLARVQFVMLPLCYLLGAGILGLRERELRRTLREQRAVAVLLGLAVALVLAAGPSKAVGYYHNALHLHPHPVAVLVSTGQNLLVLAYAGGWIIVPGALLGFWFAIARPRTRIEAAFGAFSVPFILALLIEATVFGGTNKVHERYAFSLLPLAALAFGLYASRGWPARRLHLGLLAGMVLLSAQPTLTGYAQTGSEDHAPFLYALLWLESRIGNGESAMAVAVAAAVLAAVGAVVNFRPRRGAEVLLGCAAIVCALATVGAAKFDSTNSHGLAKAMLPADRSWIDHANVGRVTLVQGYGGKAQAAEAQMFWNRSVDRVAVLQGATPTDSLATDAIHVDANGTLDVHGSAIRGALLLDEYGGTIVPRGGKVLGTSPTYTLWRPNGAPRLALYLPGRYPDGSLARQAAILLWPSKLGSGISGRLSFDLTAPDIPGGVALHIRHGNRSWQIRAARGRTVHVQVPVCSRGPWSADLSSGGHQFTFVTGRVTVPKLTADPAACR